MRPAGVWPKMPGIRLAVDAFFAPQGRGLNAFVAAQDVFFASWTCSSRNGAVTPLWQGR
jgi:hypothetical protein